MASTSTCQPSRKFMTIDQKMRVVKEYERGKRPSEIAALFGICRSEVYKIYQCKNAVSKCFQDCTVQKASKILRRKAKYAEIDQSVFDWFRFIRMRSGRRRSLPVSRGLIYKHVQSMKPKRETSTRSRPQMGGLHAGGGGTIFQNQSNCMEKPLKLTLMKQK